MRTIVFAAIIGMLVFFILGNSYLVMNAGVALLVLAIVGLIAYRFVVYKPKK